MLNLRKRHAKSRALKLFLLTGLPLAILLSPACERGRHSVVNYPVTHRHFAQEFSLSARSPVSREHGVRLISVARNGATTIELTGTRRRLSAAPGQFFVSEEFGREGLALERSSFANQSADFSRTFAVITSD